MKKNYKKRYWMVTAVNSEDMDDILARTFHSVNEPTNEQVFETLVPDAENYDMTKKYFFSEYYVKINETMIVEL
jgi:hypothetical protein